MIGRPHCAVGTLIFGMPLIKMKKEAMFFALFIIVKMRKFKVLNNS